MKPSFLILLIIGLLLSCGQESSKHGDTGFGANHTGLDTLLQKGEAYLASGQPEKNIASLEAVLADQDHQLAPTTVADITYLLARSYYDYEENELAVEKIGEAHRLFVQTNQPKKALESLALKGEIALYLNNRALADSCFAQVTTLAKAENNQEALYDALIKWSSTVREKTIAIQLLEQAFLVANTIQDTPRIIQVSQLLATEYEARGYLTQAEKYYQELLKFKNIDRKDISLIPDIRSLGGIYEKAGLFDQAQQQYIQALDIAEVNNDSLLLIELYTEISALFTQSRLWDKVEEYAQKAIQINQEAQLDLQQTLAKNLNHLGLVKEQQNDPEAAKQYYRRSLDLFQQLGDHLHSAKLNLQLAELEHKPLRLGQALQDYYLALQLKDANNERVGIMQVKMSIADILMQQGKSEEALIFLLESEKIGQAIHARDDLYKIYQDIAQIYTQKQNYQKALTYLQLSASIKDSILNQKILETTAELELKYNFDKQELEMTRQQLALSNAELKNRVLRNQILLISLLGLLFIIGLSAYTWRRRQLHRQKILMLEKEKETQRLRSIITGEENERKRIARELHDGIGALLSTVKMQFNSLSHHLPGIKSQERFQKADGLLDDACEEVRRISHNMMPGVLEHYGLEFALQQLCQNFEQSSNLDIDFIPFGLENSRDEALQLSVYRIIQELLKNVAQHAQATEVIVQATLEDEHLNIIVEDDGQGFDPDQVKQNKGIGLNNIRARVEYLGGTMDIQSSADQGSSFTIDIPVFSPTKTNSK